MARKKTRRKRAAFHPFSIPGDWLRKEGCRRFGPAREARDLPAGIFAQRAAIMLCEMPRAGAGIEWMLDVAGCRQSVLRNRPRLEAMFRFIIRRMALRPVGRPIWHRFPRTGGLTGAWILSESHITVHTFPEHGSLCLNLFCCRPAGDPEWRDLLRGLGPGVRICVRRSVRIYREC